MKKYLLNVPKEEWQGMLKGSEELWRQMEDRVYEDNMYIQADVSEDILGKDYSKWVNVETCSYTWWMDIRPGRYAETLDIDTDYFSEEDIKEIKRLQKKIIELKDKVENLDGDDIEYYDKIGMWEDEADVLANKILKIVEKELKSYEEVTDEQVYQYFEDYMLEDYYIDTNKRDCIMRDYTEHYNTTYKKGQ